MNYISLMNTEAKKHLKLSKTTTSSPKFNFELKLLILQYTQQAKT